MALHSDVALSVQLDAIMSNHRYDADPASALADLARTAKGRPGVLAEAAGTWVGYFGREPGVSPALVAALAAIPGADAYVSIGVRRRRAGSHGFHPTAPGNRIDG